MYQLPNSVLRYVINDFLTAAGLPVDRIDALRIEAGTVTVTMCVPDGVGRCMIHTDWAMVRQDIEIPIVDQVT